ncbi:LysR family transcriptional regulator [Bacillus pseudomycoides]|uniref:HTH-type transcriptional regulator CzcR n=1 Tax=Bacillus pseudomycoides TaxID=64104 RepID=A0AA91VA47_9BACI|nr:MULTISPECIES: LysR family transcriptional regulator [Bacillus]PEB51131.1 LysR family transcriptional regulator [Bacillus sp. AFS098217]PED81064.1 LysR family transcriptional regulator [Bacillus pseudomycoides]PEU16698.1 LysR family transcriptional regulator [Bacillus sp. AFS019443]PEU21572.1 LysR family transcriptional regulator [Bacillus sp. AFS014408]PFW58773.1 LysR family transcriptional regulator [Bacillus sp. AFS075034]
MDIKDLTIFHEVAKEGNISHAAQNLNYVQSNVTMRIKQLENELGTPLFYRNGKGVSLTSNGEILLTYTKQIIHLMEQSIKAVQNNGVQPKGTLKIGSTESTTAVRLPSILTSYYEMYPDVEFILETHSTEKLIQLVLERKLEGAFIAGTIHHSDLDSLLFQEEELVLVSKRPLFSFRNLGEMNILAFSKGCYYRNLLEKWLYEEGIYPKRVLEFGTIEAILACVKSGMGIAIMIKSLIQDHEHSLALTPLPKSFSRVPTTFIVRKDTFYSGALRKFIDRITNASGI